MSKSQTTTSLTPSTGTFWRTSADISYVNKARENVSNNIKNSVEEIIGAA
jgi:hypothetical protein